MSVAVLTEWVCHCGPFEFYLLRMTCYHMGEVAGEHHGSGPSFNECLKSKQDVSTLLGGEKKKDAYVKQ